MPSETDRLRERLWLAIRKAFNQFLADGALSAGAALSFYLALSLAPLVMIALWGMKLLWGQPAAGQPIVAQAQLLFGTKGAQTIAKIIGEVGRPGPGVLSLLVGLLVGLSGATGAFIHLQQSLDSIYEVKPDPNRGWGEMAWDRLISLLLVGLIGVLLVVSLALTAILSAVNVRLQSQFPGVTWVWQGVEFLGSLAIVTVLFACVYKFLPHVETSWRQVWLGAFATALLFNVGKSLAGLYLGCSSVDSVSESAEAVVTIAVWEYYSTLVILFGADLTHAYARVSGGRIQPARDALSTRAGPKPD